MLLSFFASNTLIVREYTVYWERTIVTTVRYLENWMSLSNELSCYDGSEILILSSSCSPKSLFGQLITPSALVTPFCKLSLAQSRMSPFQKN